MPIRVHSRLSRRGRALIIAATLVAAVATAGPAAAGIRTASRSATGTTAASAQIQPPAARGSLRIRGQFRDGGTVVAAGLHWRPGRLPTGDRLLSFEVGYTWAACSGRGCAPGADSTVTPFAARRYIVGHADVGRKLELTETATEVVETNPATFAFSVFHSKRQYTAARTVRGYRACRPPVSEFVDGLPEATTGSAEEYFRVDPPHYSTVDGTATQRYRIDGGGWHAMPRGRFSIPGICASVRIG